MLFNRTRSSFWLKVFDNPDSVSLSASKMTMDLINYNFEDFVLLSPTGWKVSKNNTFNYNLWIPNNRLDYEYLDLIKQWAESANHYLWLQTNRHTQDLFFGNEVDFALAPDWNIDIEQKRRTELGEAEYMLKYNSDYLSRGESERLTDMLCEAIIQCIDYIPLNNENCIVTSVPATRSNQNKLSWVIAQRIAEALGLAFVPITLTIEKTKTKNLSVLEKIESWREVYKEDANTIIEGNIYDKEILIIDDLYQSGASVWTLAEHLKRDIGVSHVYAVSAVKALKDGDNQ